MKRLFAWILVLGLLCAALPVLAADVQIGYVNENTKIYMNSSEKAVSTGNLTLGTQVRVEEEAENDGVGWYRVTVLADNSTGWVPSDNVDLVIAKKAIQPQTTPAGNTAGNSPQVVRNEGSFKVLKKSGIVDPDTLPGAPEPSMYRLIEPDTTGDAVQALRQRLYELGFMSAPNGNRLNRDVVAGIKKFQKANGLEEDGLCTPELQARVFSASALNNRGKTVVPDNQPVILTNGSVRAQNKGGGVISFTVKNQTSSKIDAFDFEMKLYNTYGNRFFLSSLSSEITMMDEIEGLTFSEERSTLNKGGSVKLSFQLSQYYYFAGCMVTITDYHTTDGETMHIPDDQRRWYAFGKGVGKDKEYIDAIVTPLTETEKRLAEAWTLGVTGVRVDPEVAESYSLREGLLVTKLTPGSPMDAAGLAAGDVLLAIGETPILGNSSLDRAKAAMAEGDTVTVLFLRNGEVYQTTLTRPSEAQSL